MAKQKAEETDKVADAIKEFETCRDGWDHNFETYKADTDFVLLENQWEESIKNTRDGRPSLTINKLKAHGRQVINDARQNKQSIKVHPVDSNADVETADIFNGLIKNIEVNSNADAAYDTAGECAVWGGFGYLRVTLDYAYDDTFEMDIRIKRVVNPLSIFGDPNSTESDSCDWNVAFVTDWMTDKEFEAEYGDKTKVDWQSETAWTGASDWRRDNGVLVAEHWSRKVVNRPIILLSDGRVIGKDESEQDDDLQAMIGAGAIEVVDQRVTKSYEVTQRIMSGVEVLKERKWPGIYIPIVPFFGDEFYVEDKRYLRSLIHSAIDSQRLYNYMRSAEAELFGLAPKVPWIGPKGIFSDPNWKSANVRNHPYLEYDAKVAQQSGQIPQRQMLDSGPALGAMQGARTASDDIKATIGQYDASLGAQSNETSGKAIMARQREGDVATFHFSDNRSRAIAHTGRILIDLAPKVYKPGRVIRILGEDGSHKAVPLGEPVPVTDKDGNPQKDQQGNPITRIYDLGRGKYDLTVSTGPSFTTRREESSTAMIELMRAYPEAAPVIAPRLAKVQDWPEAQDIAADFEKISPLNAPQIPPEMMAEIEAGKQELEQLRQENQNLKTDQSAEMAKVESTKQIELIKIAANKEIEMAKIASQREIEEAKAVIQAQATIRAAQLKPAPQQGASNGRAG